MGYWLPNENGGSFPIFLALLNEYLSSQRLFYKETEYCGSQYGSFDAEGNSKGFYFKPVITEWPCGSTDT